jgi:2-polyprenyl-3-methyl-5-hydroxy-6-metoxy-1,4-benzoquinol methylase
VFNGSEHELFDYTNYNRKLTKLDSKANSEDKIQVERRRMEALYLCKRVENVSLDSLKKGCKLLDVGCGPGDLVAELARKYPNSQIMGIDPSRFNVQEAIELHGVKILEGFWDEYQGGKVDVIIFFGNLMLHPDPKESLTRAYKLLEPNGVLIFDVKNPEDATRTALVKIRKILPVLPIVRQLYWHAFHGMPWGMPSHELRKYLGGLGFNDLSVHSFPGRTASMNGKNGLLSRVSASYDKLMGRQAWLEVRAYK